MRTTDKMSKVLVTGGSGFIGTNLVDSLLAAGALVASIDTRDPQKVVHREVFRRVDALDREELARVFDEFKPTHVVHMAAQTDLHRNSLRDYEINSVGVQCLIDALAACSSVARCLFVSSKLVCRTGYQPRSLEDYNPDTVYGQSKAGGEKIVRSSNSLECEWLIARPTSIWGPWFGIPYKPFFLTVAKGFYFHPGTANPKKSYGYVGNVVFQIQKLLEAPREIVHGKTFYLSDYDSYTIRDWANTISLQVHGRTARTIPESLLRVAAWGGTCLQKIGYKNPSMTSVRLRNMRADTTMGVSLEAMKEITGPLPYSMAEGVRQTIFWLREQGYISRSPSEERETMLRCKPVRQEDESPREVAV